MSTLVDPYNAGITWLDEPLQERTDGPLAGRTLLVKDLIDTAGIRTTYGSRLYADHVPERHATVVQRVLDAGAAIVGKANLVEFAWGVLGSNEWYGTVHNPARPGRTTGGSSSGNAAALAAGLCELGLGTDTGCSVRLPSAACELVGLKTRLGVVPIDGVYPLCPSFDTVGPMARSVRDVAVLWSVLTGRRVPEPRLDGLTRRPPAQGAEPRRRPRDRSERRGGGVGRAGSSRSAHASSSRRSPARPPTRGPSSCTRRRAPMPRPSPRAPTSTAPRCASSSRPRSASTRTR